MNRNRVDLVKSWKEEERFPFKGWDFSHLEGRIRTEDPPWDYLLLAGERMKSAQAVLDIATGGGEKLLELRKFWPEKVAATEEYRPNLRLSRERLELFGVEVLEAESSRISKLPFPDGEFDLILNRHGAFSSDEVARILRPGGVFLTQQVHGLHWDDLQAAFGVAPQWPDNTLDYYASALTTAGLRIVHGEDWSGHQEFLDVGAIVFTLMAAPWTVPGFSVDSHLETLCDLQTQQDEGGALVFHAANFLIEAKKSV
jgi:SAM-dependent methyltransferase